MSIGTYTFDIWSGLRSHEHDNNNLMYNLESELVAVLYSSSSLIIDKSELSSGCFFLLFIFYSHSIRNSNFFFKWFVEILHEKVMRIENKMKEKQRSW